LDELHSQLQTRFSTENRKISDLFNLLPEVIRGIDDLEGVASKLIFWEQDLPSPFGLDNELRRWKDQWSKESEVPHSLKDCLVHADNCFYPNIRQLLLVGCTSPVGSCEAERSFSALKRINTASRSVMTEERLTGLTLMSVHYQEALKLNVDEVVRVYVQKTQEKCSVNPLFLVIQTDKFSVLGSSD